MTAPTTFPVALANETATAHLMADLALLIGPGDLITLSGDLGAGKTALVRAVLREAGFSGPVKSPTFALLEPYNLTNLSAYHFDLYRFSSSEQWFDAGFDDILAAPGLVFVEWPEKAAGALRAPDLLVRLTSTSRDGERRLQARASGEAGRLCLNRLRTDPAIAAWSTTGSGSSDLPPTAPSPTR